MMPGTAHVAAKDSKLSENSEKPALQKALTAWNTARCAARKGRLPCKKAKKRESAPSTSTKTVSFKTCMSRRTAPEGVSMPSPPFINILWRNPMRCPASKGSAVVNVITPIPPNCIRRRTIHRDMKDRSRPVSTTIRPVTHVAEVAVNKASTKDNGLKLALAAHMQRAPDAMSARNPPTIVLSGL